MILPIVRLSAASLVAACALSVSHFAHAQMNPNRALMERLDRIERDTSLLQKQLANQPARPAFRPSTDADAKSITTGSYSADLLQQVFTLEEDVRQLRGEVETNRFEIGRLQNQLKLMQEDIDFRLKSLESNGQGTSPGINNLNSQTGSSTNQNTTQIDTSEAYRPANNASSIPSSSTAGSGTLAQPGTYEADAPRSHYNQAFRLLNQNRYEDAEQSFAEFTKKYPDDPLIGNAYYWLGETYFIREKYIEAADNFRQGYQVVPDGPKAPDNLLKLAITLKSLDRSDDACTVLEQISKKFQDAPNSLLQRAQAEQKLIGCN